MFRQKFMKNKFINVIFKRNCSSKVENIPENDIIGKIFFSSICLGASYLGIWQIQRYNWKIGIIEEAKRNLLLEAEILPVSINQDQLLDLVSKYKGKKVTLIGKFDHEKEILLGPRSAPAGLISPAQGLAINPQGYYVITPLIREDKTIVYINRGWVEKNEKSWSRPQGAVKITTVVSSGEKSGSFTPENKPISGKLFWLEPAALLINNKDKDSNTAAIILEVIEDDDKLMTNYPVARKSKYLDHHHVTPVTHIVYAVTWFSLAILGSYMTYLKFKKKSSGKKIKII